MNRVLLLCLLFLGFASSQEVTTVKTPDAVIHVHTAMDHLSILQFEDPVLKVAAGSPGFQIERDGNTVLIKPLRQNASTDLVVWTANNNRYAYELDPPGEVKNMNFTLDAPAAAKRPAEKSPTTVADVADMVLIRTLLDSQRIDTSQIKRTGTLGVRIQQIYRSAQSVYIQYSLLNNSNQLVKINSLSLAELVKAEQPDISVLGLQHKQIEGQAVQRLGKLDEKPLQIARAERLSDVLQPGSETQGVLVVRETINSPAILQITVTADSGTKKAVVVF